MVRRRQRERSVWEVVLPDADKLWPEALRRIDQVIDDEALVEVVATALEQRYPKSRRRGRPGTPAEIVLRMLILKHLYRWSYAELEHEVRANLVYRAFARIGCAAVPDAKTILKIAKSLGPAVITQLHQRIVTIAHGTGVTTGRRLRVDTTVVETNIHHPTDSSLLADGIRVVTRVAKRLEALVGRGRQALRDRTRSVTRRVLEIQYAARSPKTRDRLGASYRRLVATTRAVLRDAATMQRRAAQRVRTVTEATRRRVVRAQGKLTAIRPLVERVIAQTTQRVFHGDTHVPDKIVSLFEPHSTPIRKGKIVTPTEFGQLVTIQEADGQIVTAYAVHDGRPADVTLWEPALDAHSQIATYRKNACKADRRLLRVRVVLCRVDSRWSRNFPRNFTSRSSTRRADGARLSVALAKRSKSRKVSRYAAIVWGLAPSWLTSRSVKNRWRSDGKVDVVIVRLLPAGH